MSCIYSQRINGFLGSASRYSLMEAGLAYIRLSISLMSSNARHWNTPS